MTYSGGGLTISTWGCEWVGDGVWWEKWSVRTDAGRVGFISMRKGEDCQVVWEHARRAWPAEEAA